MAINLGSAYVDIVPSTSGLARKVQGELDPVLEQVGRKGGRSIEGGLTSGISGFARSLGGQVSGALSSAFSTASRAAVGALETTATAAGTLFATSLFSGFNRLTAIDDARGKLQGLGHDATVIDQIMSSALDSVRGTAFGLGEAASIAATAVAAGIKPGEELTEYLKLIADTSTIAGGSLGDIAAIINQTTTSGRVFTQELNQLADRGLPVFQWLADAYGVSADELRKMVSDGKVDAERFREIIESNIGGAALASGDTFRGGLANVKSAMGRFGAAVLEPFFEASKDVFPAFIQGWDNLASAVTPVVDRIADSPGFIRFTDWLKDSPNRVRSLVDELGGLGPALAPLAAATGALALGGLSSALRPLGLVLPSISPVTAALVAWIATNDELRESFGNLGQSIMEGFGRIGEAATPIMERVIPFIEQNLKSLVDWLAATGIPALSGAIATSLDFISRLGDIFRSEGLEGIASRLWEWIAEQAPILGEKFLNWGQALIGWIAPRIPDFLLELGGFIKSGAEWILRDGVPAIAEAAGSLASGLIDWIWNDAIPGALEALPGLITEFSNWIAKKGIPAFIEFGKDLGEALLDGMVEAFKDIPTPLEYFIDLTKDSSGLPTLGRATGGPVMAGMPYIVGERRAELFIPSQTGRVLPYVPDSYMDVAVPARGDQLHIHVTQLPGEDPVERALLELRKREAFLS